MIPIEHYLILSAMLFSIGLMVVVVKRNAIAVLLGLELMLNAANINLVAFNLAHPERLDGQMFAVFVIIVAACEAAVGLAIILRAYRLFHTAVPDDISTLKES
ncbi:MAG TPA: NADH-quinone oxidoreductase subunit NuoK [Cyclobacteriaceae bacterium]